MHPQRGISTIELMIGVGILAVLMAAGLPSFAAWIRDMQTRSAAESLLSGLQLARAEALKRNAPVRLSLTDTGGKLAWSIGCVTPTTAPDCPAVIQGHPATEGGQNARVGIDTASLPSPVPTGQFAAALAAGSGLPAGVSFDGFGRVPTANAGTDITRIDVTNATSAAARRLVILVGNGQLQMCDPAVSRATSFQGC